MCYVCRRAYHELEGWDHQWETGEADPASPEAKRRVPCDWLARVLFDLHLILIEGPPDPLYTPGGK